MKKVLLSLLAILLLVSLSFTLYLWISDCGVSPFRCGEYPTQKNIQTQKIPLGSGPEDMAIDHSLGYPRIIVSCDERRPEKTKKGGFYGIDLSTNKSYELTIEPADFEIYPHGIDIVTIDSVPYLYAISHYQEGDTWRHPVYRFAIKGNTLVLDESQTFENPLMRVPNDIDVLSDGSFYATNYVPNMNPSEGTKAILGFKNGSIVHYDGKEKWQIATKDFCYPNGIYVDESKNQLFVANGACHEVLRFDIAKGTINTASKQSTMQHQQKITVGDNMVVDQDGQLWVTSHPCLLDFVAHAENSSEKSPIQIFQIDPTTLKTKKVFQNSGALISAASTALYINERLYLSQIFDPYVLVVDDLSF